MSDPSGSLQDMSRGDSLARQLQLMHMLETRQVIDVPGAATHLECTPRTVYRDLQVLERVGVPIYQDRQGQKARWRVIDGYRRRLSVTLSWPEMVSLLLARKLVAELGETPLGEAAESAVQKIAGALPREIADRAQRFGGSLSAGSGPGHRHDAAAQRTLLDAIERGETVRLCYRKPGQRAAQERIVDPYLLHVHAGAVYLVGFSHERNAIRTFLLDRVRAASRTGALYGARVPFVPGDLFQGALGPWEGRSQRVRLRFSAQVAARVAERRVHSSQRMQSRSDGALDVDLRVPLCPALTSWILGWGRQVEILSPASLAERLKREHAKAAG
jgi:predicted DNA-binding transcriptional regulator YafY